MPGNIVEINNHLKWYVGDSRMEKLIEYLNKVGCREQQDEESKD